MKPWWKPRSVSILGSANGLFPQRFEERLTRLDTAEESFLSDTDSERNIATASSEWSHWLSVTAGLVLATNESGQLDPADEHETDGSAILDGCRMMDSPIIIRVSSRMAQ